MKIKCLIVDDEPFAVQLIEKHLSQMEGFEVVGTCFDAVEAREFLSCTAVDLLFLDIKMPKITGFTFLKILKNPPAVIITTAYREYAVEGYELDLVDYLLKPITFERFFKAIDRFLRLKFPASKIETKTLGDNKNQFLHIRSKGKIYRLDVVEIVYIESVKDYIIIHLLDKKVTAKYKFGDMEKELSGKNFLRIHRSFIINMDKITSFTANDIEVSTTEIPIGSSYRELVSKILEQTAINSNSTRKI
ncbi:LytR/AlgR family response regulator transcription factor [Flavobacterium sp. FlaQc-48]|uniref:LytR/AlgR family response regulator transcription factor n=1 Tax=Flavobacterium sp. FlaQc-48 TaxID=3374181 RepID=UPI003757F393